MSTDKKIHVVCPRCGSPDVLADGSARWDFEKQEWILSATYDDKVCDSCGYESSGFDEVEDGDLTPQQRACLNGEEYVKPENVA